MLPWSEEDPRDSRMRLAARGHLERVFVIFFFFFYVGL